MKPTQNAIIHVLLGVAVVSVVALLYLLLSQRGQTTLSPSEWAVFGGAALALVLAAFVPSLVRPWRRLPSPPPLSRSDIGFCIMVAMAGSAPAVIGVFSGMWWLMALGIMLAPLSFMFRGGRKRPSEQKS